MIILVLSSAGLALLLLIGFIKNRGARNYKPYPLKEEITEEITPVPVKLELVELEDDDTDVETEVINTMDYHQVPKALVAEKARKLAAGEN